MRIYALSFLPNALPRKRDFPLWFLSNSFFFLYSKWMICSALELINMTDRLMLVQHHEHQKFD